MDEVIKTEVNAVAAENARTELADILNQYCQPSFGSMSKHDVDIAMFMAMQNLGLIDNKNPNIYDVVRKLHVTRAKARNLIYEVSLRRMKSEEAMEAELRELLSNPILLKETDKVALEIDNPLLIDYLRKRLKGLNHLTDGSFSPELVKMEYDAFAHIYDNTRTAEERDNIRNRLVELGIKQELTLRNTFTALLQYGGRKLAGKLGEGVAQDIANILIDNIEEIKAYTKETKVYKSFKGMFNANAAIIQDPEEHNE